MKSTSNHKENHHQYNLLKKDGFNCLANILSLFFYSTCIAITTIFSLYLIFNHRNIKYTNNIHYFNQTSTFIPPNKEIETCDLFKGQWIPDPTGSLYTNYSCTTIPVSKNCFLHGRKDRDFLHWRWKPDKCELPRFNPETFLSILRGKKMAFIGDSLARNQMESLLCLLSTVETPKSIEKDIEDKFTTWEFPKHNFTLTAIWSQFLVAATELIVNGTATGSFDLHLDRVDARWSEKLPSIDYAVFSDGLWFIRQHYLYEGGNLIGCIFCQAPNVMDLGPGQAMRKAFRTAFKAIHDCKNCKKIVSFMRTFSPPHFENGAWNTGGCNRTRPIGRDEVDRARPDWEYRKTQMEEVEMARNAGEGRGNEFEVVDVTEMMSMRVDGHPDVHWLNRWNNMHYRDCAHWCLPGPIDTWNQLLLQKIMLSQN